MAGSRAASTEERTFSSDMLSVVVGGKERLGEGVRRAQCYVEERASKVGSVSVSVSVGR
jgi:hypothetical protein